MAYDNPIPGYGTRNTITLRLWAGKPSDQRDMVNILLIFIIIIHFKVAFFIVSISCKCQMKGVDAVFFNSFKFQ